MRNDAVEKLASADIRSVDAEALVDAKDVKQVFQRRHCS